MRNKEIVFLIILMMIFFIVFILALIDLKLGIPILDIGLSSMVSNAVVMVLSFFAIAKTIWHLAMSY